MPATRHFITQCLRLLQLVLTNLALLRPILGCSPAVVQVASADGSVFEQWLHNGMASDARRPAHLMQAYVRGDMPSKADILPREHQPEAYNIDVGSSIQPAEYHLGYAAERIIRAHYVATHAGDHVFQRGTLLDLVDEAAGNVHVLDDFGGDMVLDLGNVQARSMFEIVPPGQAHQTAANARLEQQLRLTNYAMVGVEPFKLGTDYHGELGVRFAENTVPYKLTWATVSPGTIAYQWLALRVDGSTDDAYRDAYLAHQWRTVGPQEMARLGRALHEVVERLVQAREALGQTRAATEMPLLPGKTLVDYVRSVVLWSAHDDKVARFLPLMRKPPPPAQVRRDARFIGETVIPQVPNEGYTTDGLPGTKPFQFHLGSSAHKIIAMHYKLKQQEQNKVAMNFVSIKKIVEDAGGNEKLVLAGEALLRPDIADWGYLSGNVVFEIKPDRPNYLVEGQTIVAQYLAALNRGMVGKTPFRLGENFHGNVGVKFADGLKRWNLTWRTAAPGVILYKLRRLGVSAEDQAAAEAIKRAQDEGRWIDLTVKARLDKAYQEAYDNDQWVEMTEEEMEPYAKQLEEAVDLIVSDRELMLELQDMVNVPIEMVGRISTDILSAELYRHMSSGKTTPPAKVTPAALPRRSIPQNDNGVPSPPRAPAPPPRMTPPVYKPKKAA